MSIHHQYRARPIHVVDGDTIDVEVDLGFHITRNVRLRLREVDTAEIFGVEKDSEEYERGMKQTHFVEEWLEAAECEARDDWPLNVLTEKRGKYGRYLAYVRSRDSIPGMENELTAALRREWPDVETEQ